MKALDATKKIRAAGVLLTSLTMRAPTPETLMVYASTPDKSLTAYNRSNLAQGLRGHIERVEALIVELESVSEASE